MAKVIEGMLQLPDGAQYGQITIDSKKISAIELTRSRFVQPDVRVAEHLYVSPGFVDLQINGAFGKEFKTDLDALEVVTKGLPCVGTTSICPTVTTRELDSYPGHLAALNNNRSRSLATKVLGFHLEGPFLNAKKVGAQNADLLRVPADCRLSDYASPDVAIVTLAPELEGAPALINELIRQGKKVGVGHSQVTYENLLRVFDAQNMMVVHLFNAMDGLQSRSPGLAGAALERNDYFVSVIVDGIHVDPAVVRIVWKCKEDKRRLVLVTDSSAVAGLPIGTHTVGTRRIERRSDRAVLEGTSTLVGSVLTLNVAARNLRAFTECSMAEAVNAISLNPATFLGLASMIGQIRIGNIADLAIHDQEFDIHQTYIDGEVVWAKE